MFKVISNLLISSDVDSFTNKTRGLLSRWLSNSHRWDQFVSSCLLQGMFPFHLVMPLSFNCLGIVKRVAPSLTSRALVLLFCRYSGMQDVLLCTFKLLRLIVQLICYCRWIKVMGLACLSKCPLKHDYTALAAQRRSECLLR